MRWCWRRVWEQIITWTIGEINRWNSHDKGKLISWIEIKEEGGEGRNVLVVTRSTIHEGIIVGGSTVLVLDIRKKN
ncbi:hypothetical protein [Candidatus Hodgkinia cicadicola]|uniref:hypothetical protein n=1 Tax=Candidatus Hodgkinia cicadicola TaxID=573658 RepID=UPI0011BA8A31